MLYFHVIVRKKCITKYFHDLPVFHDIKFNNFLTTLSDFIGCGCIIHFLYLNMFEICLIDFIQMHVAIYYFWSNKI